MAGAVASQATPPPQTQVRPVRPVRRGVVARPRLEAMRKAAERCRVLLVSAPAGYGKSTLVSQWCVQDPRSDCRLELGHGDNDPVVLLLRIASALARTHCVDAEILADLSSPAPRIEEIALRLLSELADCEPFILVLDEVDAITAEESRALLSLLADQFRPGWQLVLVTRGDPGVPLGRLRARGDLVEIGTALLAFDAEETRQVAALGGLELSQEGAVALHQRTEGWPAAVVLVALSLRDADDPAARAAELSGEQTEIADFLLEEVLERQPEHLRRFLLATSVLERMTAPLCDAVLRTTDAAGSLEELANSNAFIVPLDDRRDWYRYHHLFRELLHAELARRTPDNVAGYLLRAAAWCEEHERPGEAFRYAHAGGDLTRAGRIALRHRDEFARRGQSASLRLWIESCSDAEIESDPQLSLAAAWVLFYGGDGVRARRFITRAEHASLDAPSPDGASSLRSSLASIRALVAPAGITQMLRDGELVYASEKESATRWLASGCRAMGTAYVLLGRPQEAIAVLREGLGMLRDEPALAHVRVACLGYLAFAAAETGSRRDLQRWAVEAAQLVDEARLGETAAAIAAYAAGAVALLQRGSHLEAARQVDHVRRLRRHLGAATWAEVDVALRCADVSLDLGDTAGALDLAQVAEDGLQGYPDAGTLPSRLRRLQDRIRQCQDYGLTAAELRVLGFLATHLSLQEMADRLYLSRSTVKTQVASIYDKLGVSGRSDAVALIELVGLGSPYGKATIPSQRTG